MQMTETSNLGLNDSVTTVHERRKREVALAFVNALKLGASLLASWGIALFARLYIPRFLGPERFGMLNFAEAFATTAFVVLGLGVEQYVRKEIAVRPGHAGDFLGGVIALRVVLTVTIFVGMEAVLRATHRDATTRALVYIYAIAQFFIVGGNTSAGLLQAVGKINGMTILSVAIKVVWAGCMFAAIFLRLELWAFALTVAASESLRALVLFWLARKELRFEMRVSIRPTAHVLIASLPFLVSGLASTIYDKIGTNLLGFMTSDREVGWYGAAYGLSSIALMLAPVISWILTPLFARSAADSAAELSRVLCRSIELIMSLSIPISLMMILGADLWVRLLFGAAFQPAAAAVRYLALAMVLMYLSIVAFNALAVLNYTWRMSLVFVGGMLVSPTCTWLLIRHMSAEGTPGAGGTACAISTLVTEIAITGPLLLMLGKRAFDWHVVSATLKSLAAATFVVLLDAMLLRGLGHWRLLLEGLCYAGLVLGTNAVDWRSAVAMIRAAKVQQGQR